MTRKSKTGDLPRLERGGVNNNSQDDILPPKKSAMRKKWDLS